MYVAVVGCSHGEVDKIYEVVENIEQQRKIKVDILLCCGDFQSVRNMTDLRSMACPIKYQAMHDFHRYYSGEKKAPVLTLFIGGNHEASNFLQELPYGGWVAPNIYYCGYATVLKFGPIRIAATVEISGIFKGHDFNKGRYEKPPYNPSTIRSVYHYRSLEMFRMKQIKSHVDIILSHDWPKGVHHYGDVDNLLRKKPFFRQEIQQDELGSRPLFEVLSKLQPSYWFSAHLHVKFAAIIPHDPTQNSNSRSGTGAAKNSNATMTTGETSECLNSESATAEQKSTRFLALDKVLPHRPFLQIIEIPTESTTEELKLCYDAEWLAILKSTDQLVSTKDTNCYMPSHTGLGRYDYSPTTEEMEQVNEIFNGSFDISQNFSLTAPVYIENEQPQRATPLLNPQTTDFCTKLGIVDPLRLILTADDFNNDDVMDVMGESQCLGNSQLEFSYNETSSSYNQSSINPDEITFDDDDDDEDKAGGDASSSTSVTKLVDSCTRKKLVLPTPKFEPGDASGPESSTEPTASSKLHSEDGVEFFLDTAGEMQPCFVLDTQGDSSIAGDEDSTSSKRKQATESEDQDEDDELAALLMLQRKHRSENEATNEEPKCKERKSGDSGDAL